MIYYDISKSFLAQNRWSWLTVWMLVVFNAGSPIAANAATIDGTLHWNRRVELTTTVSGKVNQILVSIGTLVKNKQVLIKLDSTVFKARLMLAKAAHSKAAHVYKEAKKEKQRQKELFDRTVISTHDLELSKIAYTSALANLRQAKANMLLAQYKKSESVLRAPFDAVVLSLQVELGSVVSTRLKIQPMLVLAERGKMKVTANVGLKVLRKLTVGQAVKVVIEGKEYAGLISERGLEPVTKNYSKNKLRYQVSAVFMLAENHLLVVGQAAAIHY